MSLPSPRANHIDRTRSTKIKGYSDRLSDRLLDERAEEWPLSSAQFHPLWHPKGDLNGHLSIHRKIFGQTRWWAVCPTNTPTCCKATPRSPS